MANTSTVKPKLRAALTALLGPGQDFENACTQMLTLRNVNDATGVLLKMIGALVGQVFAGEDEEVYRRLVRARIAANRSQSLVEDLIRVSRLVCGDSPDPEQIVVHREDVATVVITIDDVFLGAGVPEALVGLLKDAVGAGVRLILEFLGGLPENAFIWDNPAAEHAWDGGEWGSSLD